MHWTVFSFLLLSDSKASGSVFLKTYLNMIGSPFNISPAKLILGCVTPIRYVVFLVFSKISGFLSVSGFVLYFMGFEVHDFVREICT